jgi:glycosyltransferase involved in cell wall biosynthesis
MSSQTLLMIAPYPPTPDTGAGIAIFGDLTELKRRGVVVDLVCFRSHRPLETLHEIKQLCRQFILVEGPPAWSLKTPWLTLLQQPLVVVRHRSLPMQQAIAAQLASHPYDVVLVEFSFMFQYLLRPDLIFTQDKQPLLVVDHLVVTPKVYQYFHQVAPTPLAKLFRQYEIPRLKKYLQKVLLTADKHLFVGQEDLAYVQNQFPGLPNEKLIYRPIGLLLERYPLADPAQAEPFTLGFFGAFDWAANVDAVHYFVREILPLIQAQMPQVKFVLAGRAGPASVRALADHPAIEFVGKVEDMFSLAQRVAVIVVPLRIGAGTRLKILEAMAWGKPIVATSIGVEGIEQVVGQDLLVADEPETFAHAVVTLLNDPLQQMRLAQAGRRRVELSYTAQRSVDRLQQALPIPSGDFVINATGFGG